VHGCVREESGFEDQPHDGLRNCKSLVLRNVAVFLTGLGDD
jgi:hypothetical protein